MNHSKPSTNFFSQQLVYIEENIQELTTLYFSSTPVQERIKHFFSLYVLEVDDLLKENRNSTFISSIPKVFIGTKVTVLYNDDNETEDYTICLPEQSEPDQGHISFLSPVGRQLLLKNLGEQLSLKIPTGELQVTIKEISFVGNFFDAQKKYKEA